MFIEMKLWELRALVNQGEGQTIEFKRKATFPEKITKEIVAFANSNDGYLLIGVDDNGDIPGLKHLMEEKFVLDNAIRTHIKPVIKIRSSVVPVNEKRSVLVYRIFVSRRKPVFYIPGTREKGIVFIRIKDKSVQASREMVEIFRGQRRKKGINIHYGEKETILMRYIDKHKRITINQFREAANISRREASDTLVRLVLSNILKISAGEKTDWYRATDQYN